MSELARRHEHVAATAARTPVATADVVTTLGLLGETVEDLKARLPDMRNLHDWLVRIEGKLDAVLRSR